LPPVARLVTTSASVLKRKKSLALQRTVLIGSALLALAVGGYALRDHIVPVAPQHAPVPAPAPPPQAEGAPAGAVPAAQPESATDAPVPDAAEAPPAPPDATASDTAPDNAPDAPDVRHAAPEAPEPVEAVAGASEVAGPPPAFDVVRVAADGGALVAGVAAPGARVVLLVDGRPVAEAIADAAGQFVMMFRLEPSDEAQAMTLESRGDDGVVVAAVDTVILAPRRPVALAGLAADGADPPADEAAQRSDPALPAPPAPAEARVASLPTAPDTATRAPAAPPVLAGPPAATDDSATDDTATDDVAPPTASADDAPGPAPAVRVPDAATAAAAPPAGDGDLPPGPMAAAQVDAVEAFQPAPPGSGAAARPAPELAPPSSGPVVAAPPPATPEVAHDPPPADDPADPGAEGPELTASAPLAQEPADVVPPAFVLRQSGAVEIAGAPPPPANAVVIDAISYSDTGAVQISGRAGRADPEARIQLYLDNEPLVLAQAESGSWSVAVPDLAPGLYTLRADQLAGDGRVATRYETPFQRAAPEDIRRPPTRREDAEAGPAQLVTVQPGNSLWRISREHYGEGVRYVQIYQANIDQIRDPDLIYPGQIFVIPD
jgi:hypothetical protein